MKGDYFKIKDDFLAYRDQSRKKVQNLYFCAAKELGDYSITKGFKHLVIKDIHYYYNPNTRIGFKANIPESDQINLERDGVYNLNVHFSIVYKLKLDFIPCGVGFLYMIEFEDVEKSFSRFKKHNSNAGISKIKEYLQFAHRKEMLLIDRYDKIKKIQGE